MEREIPVTLLNSGILRFLYAFKITHLKNDRSKKIKNTSCSCQTLIGLNHLVQGFLGPKRGHVGKVDKRARWTRGQVTKKSFK